MTQKPISAPVAAILHRVKLKAFRFCPFCYWEDDGQGDENSHVVRWARKAMKPFWGGPNRDLGLKGARINYNLVLAFPGSMVQVASKAVRNLPDPISSTLNSFHVNIKDESVAIPYRTYHDCVPDFHSLDNVERQIISCLYTRNCSGYLREDSVRMLLKTEPTQWHTPFVLSLLGEHVLEIIQVLHENSHVLTSEAYTNFASENPRFVGVIKRRIVSYWNEYYRRQFPEFKAYPGYQVAAALDWWNQNDVPKILRD